MVLFLSDIHFGRGDAAHERAKEADLLACLRAHEAEVEALYLVGDVFDEYIEYRTLVPKGFIRFQALLASWTDQGIPVTYLVGNHDPWHLDYFTRELGVRVVHDHVLVTHGCRTVYLAHGDGLASSDRPYRWLKPVLRHPLPVWLYRTLLPGDAGMRLARWVNRRVTDETPDPDTIQELTAYARQLLHTTEADLVVLGHSHQAALLTWPEGTYLNPGFWADARTFGILRNDKIHLVRWNGDQTVAVDPEH